MIDKYLLQVLLTAGLILFYIIVRIVFLKIIKRHASKNDFDQSRVSIVRKITDIILSITVVAIILILWEVSLEGLSLYFASFFTVAGIGLFAQWSILSNITSAIILFFYFPYKIGSKVKIIDGENSIIGTVKDITVFVIKIETEDGSEISYPNNLAVQKPIQKIT